MSGPSDTLSCYGIVCETEIGFKEAERGIKQPLEIDFEAVVSPIPQAKFDKVEARQIDYFDAYQTIRGLVAERRFNLIESIAETVAARLLKDFPIHSVTVRVAKRPTDMPHFSRVVYSCTRQRPQ